MDKAEAMQVLRALGTAQNRKVYERHGVRGPAFGVSYANLGKLKQRIGTDHGLARALWGTGNHDARVLATMVADAETVTANELDRWVKDADSYPLANALAGLAARSSAARRCADKWIRAKGELVGASGWDILARLAASDSQLSDAALEQHLETIESRIHKSPNRTRYAMNGCLIAIGARNPKLERKAIAAAQRIGMVEIDHGETGCKTPDAVAYIRKMAARKKKRASSRAG